MYTLVLSWLSKSSPTHEVFASFRAALIAPAVFEGPYDLVASYSASLKTSTTIILYLSGNSDTEVQSALKIEPWNSNIKWKQQQLCRNDNISTSPKKIPAYVPNGKKG